jgi:hypothetical protein
MLSCGVGQCLVIFISMFKHCMIIGRRPNIFYFGFQSLQRTLDLSKASNGQAPKVELVERNTTTVFATNKDIPEEKQFLVICPPRLANLPASPFTFAHLCWSGIWEILCTMRILYIYILSLKFCRQLSFRDELFLLAFKVLQVLGKLSTFAPASISRT